MCLHFLLIMTLLESEHLTNLEKGFKEADQILEESAKTRQKVICFFAILLTYNLYL